MGLSEHFSAPIPGIPDVGIGLGSNTPTARVSGSMALIITTGCAVCTSTASSLTSLRRWTQGAWPEVIRPTLSDYQGLGDIHRYAKGPRLVLQD